MTNSPKSKNLAWFDGHVKREDRERLHGHRGLVVWFTGLSGSGKSTMANMVARRLYEAGVSTYVLDGDNIRHGLNRDLGFSPEDREENIRRIGEVASLFADAGLVVLTAFISPYRADRRLARSLVEEGRFFEVFMSCSVEACEARDKRGIYAKARAGEIKEFTGISAPYEEPEKPELVLMSGIDDEDCCLMQVLTAIPV